HTRSFSSTPDAQNPKPPQNTAMFITHVNGGGPKRLTSNQGRDSDPQWAPDSSSLVFLSTRPGNAGSQLYRIPAEGGAPAALTRHPTTISSFAWSPDGKEIAFLATEPPSEALKKRLQRGDDGITLDS